MSGTSRPSKSSASLEAHAFVSLQKAADGLGQQVEQLLKANDLTAAQYNTLRILRGAEPEGLAVQQHRRPHDFARSRYDAPSRSHGKALADHTRAPERRPPRRESAHHATRARSAENARSARSRTAQAPVPARAGRAVKAIDRIARSSPGERSVRASEVLFVKRRIYRSEFRMETKIKGEKQWANL